MTLTPDQILMIVSMSLAAGGFIVKLTPTKVDDEWWQKLTAAVRGMRKGAK